MRYAVSAALAATAVMSASGARADDCGPLWFARNQIFQSAGYCFKTARAIRTFGNAGCSYHDLRDVPLSYLDRSRVDAIIQNETALGCRD